MRRFEPVWLPEDRVPQGRAAQTFLRHFANCPRSGYLYLLYRGEARTAEMERGRAGHAIWERSIRASLEQDEPTAPPPEVMKVIADEVLADPAFHVPFEEHDYLREAAYRFGSEWTLDPAGVVAVEGLFQLEVGGWMVRCRVDFAELREEGAVCYVADFKSGRGAPAFEDVARKRPDGSMAAKQFQLVLYALVLAFGVPVRVEVCGRCGGVGCEGDGSNGCAMRGYFETPEPFPVASRAQRFDLEYVYPGIEDREGKMLRRPLSLDRFELDAYRASLEGLVARVQASLETGAWPAVVSDAACSECPASSLCPIPPELRDHRGTVNTEADAAEALTVLDREKADHRARHAEVRNWIKANGGVLYFDGKVAELVYSEYEAVTDRDGLLAAVDRAVRYGESFERSDFVKTRGKTDLKIRDVVSDEIEAPAGVEGSNG